MEGADGNHTGSSWRQRSADHRLQSHDNLRAQNNRVDSTMGRSAVCANAGNVDIDGIRAGIRRIGRCADHPRGHGRSHVERHRVIWLTEPLPKVIGHHRGGTQHALLCRLTNQHQRALPLITLFCHELCGPDQTGDVHVVATGVHNKHFIAVGIDLLRPRRIGEPRLFLHRQAVHIGPEHHQRALAIFQ